MLRSSSPSEYPCDHTTTTRSTSPLHFLNPAMAHLHHSHCHSQSHRAAAAAADISRLLDPSYIPSSSSRAAHVSPTAVTAYVDPHGDLHDPDYRHFPVSHHTHQAPNKNLNGRRGASPRPHFDWEMDLDEHALDDEYDEEDPYTKNLNARYASSSSRSWSSSNPSALSRPRESSFSTMSMYSPTYYSPTGTASTLPTSYEDDEALPAESPFDEKEKKKGRRLSKGEKEKEKMKALEKEREEKERVEKEAEAERERERERAQEAKERETRRSNDFGDLTQGPSSPQRRSQSHGRSPRSRRRSLDLYFEEDERRPEDLDDEDDDSAHLHPGSSASRGAEHDYAPTCTQSLRRQWQALALSFRFSVFRAQRRMTRRVASLTT